MSTRHPLPYAYAKAHTVLLEDTGSQLVLWAGESVSPATLGEVLRLYSVDAHVFHLFWSFLPEAAEALRSAGEFAKRRSSPARVARPARP